jgi:flagellar hook-associated protein 2
MVWLIAQSTMDLSMSGLASGFDWKTFVDQVIATQRTPITNLNNEKTTNLNKKAALVDLNAKLTALQASTTALANASLFTGRKATSSTANSTWNPVAAAGTPAGSYSIAVTQLATAAHLDGAQHVGKPLNPTNNVTTLTMSSLPTAVAATAGTFSVNGKTVTFALTDSLDQVFTAISTATSGAVTAAYDSVADKITLSSASPIMLGAANDTSNFLSVAKLGNNGTGTVTSASTLGTADKYATLANARLSTAITAVDGLGNGSFTVNGVSIAYNVNTDSLSGVLQRINASTAGVTASYDSTADRVVLTNNTTGDIGVSVNETAGGLLGALGLTTGATLTRGKNALYTVNGGATITSTSNTLADTSHGITGLSVTVDSLSTQNITVSGDTASMTSAIQDFITKYNDVQTYIDDQSKITTTVAGKVTTSVFSGDREVQSWADSLRSIAFGAVSGLSGTISRLDNLGIDFTAGTGQLSIKDSAKLNTALTTKASDVAQFFQTSSTGLAAQVQTFLTKVTAQDTAQQTQLTATNTDLDAQIATLQRRLDQQKAILTSSFIAMETAQSQLKSQSDALTKAFSTSSSSSK